jgi:tyrosinase
MARSRKGSSSRSNTDKGSTDKTDKTSADQAKPADAQATPPQAGAGQQPASQPRPLGVPTRPAQPAKTFTSKEVPIDFAGPEHRYSRADLEIDGIFHGEASYEGRIFFNNPKADDKTPRTLENGYAGSFHIFGHGGCLGDPGHCEVNEHNREDYDFRPPHPLTPAKKRVTVTDALREVAKNNKTVTVTVVPVVTAANELCDTDNVFRSENMKFVTYN